MMRETNITLTWDQMPAEAYRRDRLLMVIGYVLAVRPGCFERLVGLHDSKGKLLVTWREAIRYGGDTAAFCLAWESQGEITEEVEHVTERRKEERHLGAGQLPAAYLAARET